MTRARASVAVVALAALLAACSGGGKASDRSRRATTTLPSAAAASLRAPSGDLYQPPAGMRSAKPGTLIWAQLYAQTAAHPLITPPATIWQILYHSRDRAGHDIAVSGFAVVPNGRPPRAGRPVYAWAHGLAGLGDSCAPSKAIQNHLPPYSGAQLARGAVVVATDYEGLGTPGDHPYLAGVSAGRDVLDSVRAAATLPNAGPIADVVVAGVSEGGGAALWAAQIARAYAPELHLRGVIALAPDAELPTIAASLDKTGGSNPGLALLAADGLHAAYPDFDPSTFLTPAAVADLARVRSECAAATLARYRGRNPNAVLRRNPDSVPAVHTVLVDNSPGATDPHVPILILQGGADTQIPLAVSAQLHARYCALHATVTRVVLGANHDELVSAAQPDVLRWLTERYTNKPARSDCPTA